VKKVQREADKKIKGNKDGKNRKHSLRSVSQKALPEVSPTSVRRDKTGAKDVRCGGRAVEEEGRRMNVKS
jgi:hypothetical protein